MYHVWAHTSLYESLPFFFTPKWHMTKTIKSFAKHMKMKIQHHSRQLSRSSCTVCSLDNAKSNAACGHFWYILTDPCNFVLCMIFRLLQLWRLIRMLNFVVSNYLSINFVFIKMLSEYDWERDRERKKIYGKSTLEVNLTQNDKFKVRQSEWNSIRTEWVLLAEGCLQWKWRWGNELQ